MSYIRSSCNPEALYIWGDKDDNLTVMRADKIIGTIPEQIFDGLIKKYIKNNCPEPCSYKGVKIEEIYTNDGNIKTKLSYNNWEVVMWDVTWNYIAYSNYKLINKKKSHQ